MNAKNVTVSRGILAWLLTALTALASSACADDEPKPNDGSTATDSAFAKCSQGALESDRGDDTALAGPGIDPATGQLAAGDYQIATTYLALQPNKAARALELGGAVVQSLFGMHGFVAFSTTQSNSCATLRTLTVWETEEDMLAFVTSPAHAAAMSEVSELSRGSSNTTAWKGSEKDATWERAAGYLAAETREGH